MIRQETLTSPFACARYSIIARTRTSSLPELTSPRPAGVDVHARVIQHLLLELLLGGVEPAEDGLGSQGVDVGGERGGAVARLHEDGEWLGLRLRRLGTRDAAAGDAGELEVAEQLDPGGLGLLHSERVLAGGHVRRD